MKLKNFLLACIVLAGALFAGCSAAMQTIQQNAAPDYIAADGSSLGSLGYSLVWNDEFTGGSLDTSKWGYEIGNNNGWGNNEIQNYTKTSSNVAVSDGTLKITALKDEQDKWTSGRILTRGKYSCTYGYIEARVKLPEGNGMWPAFWMLGVTQMDTINWPDTGEIDIMEYSPSTTGTDMIYSTVHTKNGNGGSGTSLSGGRRKIEAVSDDFHRFGVLWTEEYLQVYYDGVKVGEKYAPTAKTAGNWPFDMTNFIILNMAIGGVLGGIIDPQTTRFVYEVDYVRVYQKQD